MSEVAERSRSVCDLTLVMRTRLLCGLYNHRAVPPRWRRLAQAYCATLIIAVSIPAVNIMKRMLFIRPLSFLIMISDVGQFFFSGVISLWIADEYIYNFFIQNRYTDVTLDSPIIFHRLQRRLKQMYLFALFNLLAVFISNNLILFFRSFSVIDMIKRTGSVLVVQTLLASSYTTKFLIMALFNARLLVLKRRLLRYGFRIVGRRQIQPYFQIYNEIRQALDETDNPLKLLLFFDLIFSCGKFIGTFINIIYDWTDQPLILLLINAVALLTQTIFYTLGHVPLLESAAEHCEDMVKFTVTELIKNPTDEERRHMRALLDVLENRGARYCVLRALPLDTRLVLGMLGFCTAQVLLFVQTIYVH